VRVTLGRPIALIALAGCAAAWAGCTTTKSIYEKQGTKVQLVSKRGQDLDLSHPITIAPVRLTYILSSIDIRFSSGDNQQRGPAIPLESLEAIAEGLARGLREAGPNQRVVVYSVRRAKHLKIFDANFLTSFIAYAQGDFLYVHLSRADWEVPPRRQDNLPEPEIGEHPMQFRVLPSKAMKTVDEQSVAIAWRDDTFSKPTRLRMTPTGGMVRRTILMESDEPEEEADTGAGEAQPDPELAVPSGMSPATLRDLADLEEQRQRGQISEYDYEQRRREILSADPAARSN
jgi:hypothetical protein